MPQQDRNGPAPAPDHCAACPIRSLTPYGGVRDDEADRLAGIRNRTMQVPANTDVFAVDDEPAEVLTLFAGWAYRYTRFSDGARQILSIVLPGEGIGLSTLPGGRMSHAVSTLTACTFCCLDKAELRDYLIEDHEACQSVFSYTIARHNRTERQLALLGRRQARQRVAAVLVDLHRRLYRLGLADAREFPFPLRHSHLADLVGLTPIHVSRVFRDLEADRTVRRLQRRVQILDPARLEALADDAGDRDAA
ncbi:MAG: Crp/Fnr family transcriptional regulator [Rhodovibrio sp.]|nr:Crp/Fnr family transcriptional regulator [Rhodovibrio sp.]